MNAWGDMRGLGYPSLALGYPSWLKVFRVQDYSSKFKVQGSKFTVQRPKSNVQGPQCEVQGSKFKVERHTYMSKVQGPRSQQGQYWAFIWVLFFLTEYLSLTSLRDPPHLTSPAGGEELLLILQSKPLPVRDNSWPSTSSIGQS